MQGTVLVGLQVGALWGLIQLLRLARAGLWWGVEQAKLGVRHWWRGLLVVVVLGGLLQRCADSCRTLANIYGCDPAAVEHSLQTQVAQLFTLSTGPTNATALEQRLTAIRQVITDSYIYAMRTQTLLFTALRTMQHLTGLVGAIDKFVGNKQGYQSMAQMQAQISLTIEKLSMQTAAFQRAQALDRLQDQILVHSLIQINRATMADHP